MEYNTLLQEQASLSYMEPVGINSLYSSFQSLRDPRQRKGKRYDLAVLLPLSLLAKLAGETTLSGATHWVRLRGDWLAQQLGLKRPDMPCQNTSRSLLALLDAQEISCILAAFFTRLPKSVPVCR